MSSARLALARLHGQMAALTQREEDAIRGEDFPPRELTPEDRAQIEHLRDIGEAAFDRMKRLAPRESDGPFYDFIFAIDP